jgi:hypothetical protein
MATQYANGRIITNGLVLALDAADRNSYVSGSTVWNDVSGNGNNGTLTNGPTFSNNSIVFDGIDDYITLGNPSSLDTLNFTICAWAKSNTFSNYQNIIFKGTNVGQYGIALNSVGDWVIQPNANQGSTFIGDIITLNTWNFFAGTYNGTQITAYRNGIQKQQYNNPQSNYGNIVTIGTDTVNNRPFNGSIPAVQIYNRALSAQEILQNYNAQKSRFNL